MDDEWSLRIFLWALFMGLGNAGIKCLGSLDRIVNFPFEWFYEKLLRENETMRESKV